MIVDRVALDARDFIHFHPGQTTDKLPPRKVVPHLAGLLRSNLIASNTDGAFFCQCARCKEAMPCCLGYGLERGRCKGCRKVIDHAR